MKAKQWMVNDIHKSIQLKESRPAEGAPNILIALGLSCYTEYWGKLLLGLPIDDSRKCYEAFFRRLETSYVSNPYEALLDRGVLVYQDVRCGLVHAYVVDRDCKVTLDEGSCGICYDENTDRYDFYIKTYFKDFQSAVESYIDGLNKGAESVLKLNNAIKGKPLIL